MQMVQGLVGARPWVMVQQLQGLRDGERGKLWALPSFGDD